MKDASLVISVGVTGHLLLWFAAPNGHQQGINRQIAGHLRLH